MSQARAVAKASNGGMWVNVDVFVGSPNGHGHVLRWGTVEKVEVTEGQVPPDGTGLFVDEQVARAIYDALARYFGGAFDSTQLRGDFLHERQRVDKLIDHVIGHSQ